MAGPNTFFLYNDTNIPAYRDAKGFLLVMDDGTEKPVQDLTKFVDNAMPVSEAEFEAHKAERLAAWKRSTGAA